MQRRYLGMFASILLGTLAINYPTVAPGNLEWGGENGHIANALLEGRGFSDPFGQGGDGPTAWMPPLYPALLALVQKLLGVGSMASLYTLLLIKALVLTWTAKLCEEWLRRTGAGPAARWVVPLFLAGLFVRPWASFGFMHDDWIVALCVVLCLNLLGRIQAGEATTAAFVLILFLTAHAAPVVLFAFLLVLLSPAVRTPLAGKLRYLGLVALIVLPWTTRNLVQFGRVIPIKSNAAFDLWQSNVAEPGGLILSTTFERVHPYANEGKQAEYAARGEVEFLREHAIRFQSWLAENPLTFAGNILRRTLAATFVHPALLLGRGRLDARTALYSLYGLIFGLWLMKRARPGAPEMLILVLVVGYLLPYCVVGFYYRYRLPLMPLMVLALFWCLQGLAARLPRRSSTRSPA